MLGRKNKGGYIVFNINKKTNKIYLTKGDNAQIVIKVLANGVERQLFDDDVITLTLRKNSDSTEVALTKDAEKGVINIVPADTKSLTAGTYVYDIQLTTFGGNVYTILPISYFELGQEVTQ